MRDLPVNPADLTVVILIVLSGLFAMARGFVREVLSLASWVGAALVTLWGYSYALPYTKRLIDSPFLAQVVTYLGLFIVSLIIFSMIGGGIASLIRGSTLNALDRALGFVFGLLRGALIVAVLWLGLAWMLKDNPPEWLEDAKLRPAVERLADFLRNLAPPEFRARALSAGDQMNGGIRQVQQYESILRAPATPQAKNPALAGETGYKTDERRGLDGLIQRAQPVEAAAPSR
jgi:membrane protein required for colicin V production